MDIIFKLGIILLPFENLFFAPSAGWATITPIIWAVYVLFNFKLMFKSIYKYRYIFIFLLLGILISLINYLFVNIVPLNFINAMISIGLGIVLLISFDIYFIQKQHSVKSIVKLLLITYSISLAIGWIQFFAVKFNIVGLKEFFILIEKRSYIRVNRIQFTFTEPSFIGMHIFGVLLPIYLYVKDKKLLKIIIAFCVSSLIFSSGVRIVLDILVVTILYLVGKNIKNIKFILALMITIVIMIPTIFVFYNSNLRIKNIIDNGIYADGSLASRYFRINSSVKGYMNDPINLLFGYGIGNSFTAISSGYDDAVKEYKSSFRIEVEALGNKSFIGDSVSYCLYTRIISEFGIIMLVVFITYLFCISRNTKLNVYFLILLYLYLQFESYAFYTLWLFIILAKKEKMESTKNVIGNLES